MTSEYTNRLWANLRVTYGLFLRWFREVTVAPVAILVIVTIQPITWYVLFGNLFEATAMAPGFPSENYRAFIIPGIVALMSLEAIVIGGACVVHDLQDGFLQKMWAAPISRSSVVFGRLGVMSVLTALQISVLFVIAYVDGVTIAAGLSGVVAIIGMGALITSTATAISLFIAYTIRYEFSYMMFVTAFLLPLLFVSNAFMPTELMPDWLGTLAEANPISTAITGMRSLVLDGWVLDEVLPAVALLLAITILTAGATSIVFTRSIDSDGQTISDLITSRGN